MLRSVNIVLPSEIWLQVRNNHFFNIRNNEKLIINPCNDSVLHVCTLQKPQHKHQDLLTSCCVEAQSSQCLSADPKWAQSPTHGIRGENESNPHSHPLPRTGRAAGPKLLPEPTPAVTPPCWVISLLPPLERSSSFKGPAALCYCITAHIHLAHRSIIIKQSKGWPEKVNLVLQTKKMAKLLA